MNIVKDGMLHGGDEQIRAAVTTKQQKYVSHNIPV